MLDLTPCAVRFRYLILHKNGGVYVDIDIECKEKLDSLWETEFVSTGGMFLHTTTPLG